MRDLVVTPTPKSRVVACARLAATVVAVYVLYKAAILYGQFVTPLVLCKQLPYIRLVVVAASIVLAILCIFLVRGAWMIWRSGQVPAPGTAVFFTTRVYTGLWARLNAVSMLVVAAVVGWLLAQLLSYFVFSAVGPYLLGYQACVA